MSERRSEEGNQEGRKQQREEEKETKGKRKPRRTKKYYPYQSTKQKAPIPQSSVDLYEVLSGADTNYHCKFKDREEALKKMPKCMVNCTFPENDICYTPLHKAALEENIKHCEILLNRGADMQAMNREGDTFIDVALKWGSESFQRDLAVVVRKVREKRAKMKMSKNKRKVA